VSIEFVNYQVYRYPKFQTEGFSSQFCWPFAQRFCKGVGYDVGCGRQEWVLPGARGIDLNFKDGYDAYNLPDGEVDYIFSSHCLEHLPNWIDALDHWTSRLKKNGVLFLYLPHYDQQYWRPWNNRKHIHALTFELIKDYLESRKYVNILHGDRDLNHSFTVVAEKII
jgi:SAM-dependent methyltransferase